MKSRARRKSGGVECWKQRAARRLAGLKGTALQKELELAVARVEREMGVKLPRYKGPMATPRRLRRAQ